MLFDKSEEGMKHKSLKVAHDEQLDKAMYARLNVLKEDISIRRINLKYLKYLLDLIQLIYLTSSISVDVILCFFI